MWSEPRRVGIATVSPVRPRFSGHMPSFTGDIYSVRVDLVLVELRCSLLPWGWTGQMSLNRRGQGSLSSTEGHVGLVPGAYFLASMGRQTQEAERPATSQVSLYHLQLKISLLAFSIFHLNTTCNSLMPNSRHKTAVSTVVRPIKGQAAFCKWKTMYLGPGPGEKLCYFHLSCFLTQICAEHLCQGL